MQDRPQFDRLDVGKRHVRRNLHGPLLALAVQLARYSLVSRYGPSVTAGRPSARRISLALTAPSSSPVYRYLVLKASCLAIDSGRSSAGRDSISPGSPRSSAGASRPGFFRCFRHLIVAIPPAARRTGNRTGAPRPSRPAGVAGPVGG
jgi:hypothetical protein